ncbi:MAG: winged helix-turn-helix transcriptional regulator [Clostridiaceae bacterium]|nr:winged helix-turn-helix transcriptional regulator [Clostridiaceae bacterium]
MDKELILLREIHLKPTITQRDMAKVLGLSLGSVNDLLKRMVKIGVVEIEKISQKRTKYQLTSLGISQKAEGTYKYISELYRYLKDLNKNIDNLLSSINDDSIVVLFGENDDVFDVIKMILDKRGRQYITAVSYEELDTLSGKDKLLLIAWQPENIKLLNYSEYNCIDLLNCI